MNRLIDRTTDHTCPNCLRPMTEWLKPIWFCRACNLKVKGRGR